MTMKLDKLRQTVMLRRDTTGPGDDAGLSVDRSMTKRPVIKRPIVRYGAPQQDVRHSVWSFKTLRWLLLAFLVVSFYYVVLASDRYATVAQVYIKSAGGKARALPQAAFLNLSSPDRQDALLVREYIHSRDMLELMDEKLDLKSHYSDGGWDFIARLSKDASDEDFLKYYQQHVNIIFSQDSSILTIETQAFDAEFSHKLVTEIIAQAEKFINQISQDIAEQETEFVRGEVERAKSELSVAQENLTKFQRENQLLNAEASGEALQGVVNELEGEISRAKAEEKALTSYLNDDAAALVVLRGRIQGLEEQLVQEKQKISEADGRAINDVGLAFRRLELELGLATDLYTAALASLEQARVEAYRKLKYMVVVQAPRVPTEALYPRRAYNLATIFIVMMLVYGVLAMVVATIREHRDV